MKSATSLTGTIKSTSLEASLGKTDLGKFIPQIDSILRKSFSQKGDNIEIPALQYLFQQIPEMEQVFINKYNAHMGLEKGVEVIPDSVKASQGALLDGLMFGFDMETGEYALYTMNFDLLKISADENSRPTQIMNANKKGLLKSYRVDVEYLQSPEAFNFKLVNHRKEIDDDTKVLLVPYLAVLRLMLMIESLLKGNLVLKTKQNLNGAKKIRVITLKDKVLSEFCDDPNAPKALGAMFFPLKGFFYAPVVGAPSTTSMVSNIDIFKLDELKKISDIAGIRNLGIEKPKSGIYSLVSEQVICGTLNEMRVNEPERYIRIVKSLPNAVEIMGDNDDYTPYVISKYLHSIRQDDMERVISLVPGAKKEIKYREGMFKSPVQVTDLSVDNLKDLLRNHVLKFIVKKKDCKLTSVTGTNDEVMLRNIYGRDYFAEYESFNLRFSKFLEALTYGVSADEALREYGFMNDEAILEKVEEITKAAEVSGKSFEDELKRAVADNEGVKIRKSSSSPNTILLRMLNAYIDENGKAQEYYRSVDAEGIVDVLMLS